MTFTNNRKSFGTLALTFAVAASLSASAFAAETSSATMVSSTAASVATSVQVEESRPMGEITSSTAAIEFRTNEKTGQDEISKDHGKTWVLYDGNAFTCTSAIVGTNPSK